MSQIRVFVTCCQLWDVFFLVDLTSNERENSTKSVDLLVATIDDISVVKLAQQIIFMCKFTDFNVRSGPVGKEEVLILSICLNPGLQVV